MKSPNKKWNHTNSVYMRMLMLSNLPEYANRTGVAASAKMQPIRVVDRERMEEEMRRHFIELWRRS